MFNFTQEHYDKLKPFAHYWSRFKQTDSLNIKNNNDFGILKDYYLEWTGKVVGGCSSCVIDMIRSLFIPFDKFEEQLRIEELQKANAKPSRPRINQK